MSRTPRRLFGITILVALFSWGLPALTLRAGIINYGNSPNLPPGVMFLNVTESSATDDVPLYGPPSYFSVGMDFDPLGFGASGQAGSVDITNGQLNFGVKGDTSPQLVAISQVRLSEAGDYTLTGTGTSATQALAGAIMRVTVTEIDGMAVPPLNLIPVNASVGFNLAANAGTVQPWSLGLTLNVEAQLTSMNVPFVAGATGLEVVINNDLSAISQASSVALMSKKDFRITLETEVIPEPAGATLAGSALLALLARRRSGLIHR